MLLPFLSSSSADTELKAFSCSLLRIVRGGETISSTEFSRRAGGKGANQACAVARSLSSDSAAGKVELKGAVGADGVWVRDLLEGYGVGVDGVQVRGGESTGRAIIQLDAKGENSISLSNLPFFPMF
jgi:ribokinase